MTKRHAEYFVIIFFLMVIETVLQQIATSMTEQGIASRTPCDKAAAYPRAVAISVGALLVCVGLNNWRERTIPMPLSISQMRRPAGPTAIFSIYLLGLGIWGYHLSTTPMLMSLPWVAGYRRPVLALICRMPLVRCSLFVWSFLKYCSVWRYITPQYYVVVWCC